MRVRALVLGLMLAASSGAFAAEELRLGRYIGYLILDSRGEKVALTADVFLEAPEDFTQFPKLNVILKESLGGYNTSEYVTQVFKGVRYDFDHGVLNLDEPESDLVVSARVHSRGGRPRLMGSVWIRSSAMSASLDLEYETDEPGDDLRVHESLPELPFVPLLEGQYTGQCAGRPSVFQIQTMKGLAKRESGDPRPVFEYEIVGRMGNREPEASGSSDAPWSVSGSFAGGSYNFYTGKLYFFGPSSAALECRLGQGKLSCQRRVQQGRELCEFKKDELQTRTAFFHRRTHHVIPSPEQVRELPLASPPMNAELTRTLGGIFSGYLHNEATGLYQPIRLQVVASSSTENPHNPNKAFVSTTAILHFGGNGLSEDFYTQRYEPRSFYVRPGFTLNAPGTDSFIGIEEWKTGYIRGVWYSHAFGRVGTVELLKGDLPGIPGSAKMLPGWTGEYQGGSIAHWFSLVLPSQAAERIESTVSLIGSYQTLIGMTRIEAIERGRYDPYTGVLAWVLSANGGETLISAKVAEEGRLWVFWPPTPGSFGALMKDLKHELFERTSAIGEAK